MAIVGRHQFTLWRLLMVVGALGVVLGALVGAERVYYWWLYPYGSSHCCDMALWGSLRTYADLHGGVFPAGEATPEASLSLLYPQLANTELLRGKTIPRTAAQAALDTNGRLDPSSCDWHYVEGLTTNDDRNLALFWDKVGLGHNGNRLPGGGHSVVYLGGAREHITEDRWQEFLAEQDKLLARRSLRPASSAGSSTSP